MKSKIVELIEAESRVWDRGKWGDLGEGYRVSVMQCK